MDEGGLTENELGAVFTCGAWSVQGGRFLVGIARDKYGTKITVCVCLVMVLCGSVLVATSASDNLAGMCFGMLFLGMGSGAQLCVQPVAGLFPEATSTAMASLSGAFQLSGLVFLACSFVADAGAGRFGAYMGHAGLVALLFVFSLKALPMGVSFEPEERPVAEDENEAAAKDDVDSNKKPPTRTPRAPRPPIPRDALGIRIRAAGTATATETATRPRSSSSSIAPRSTPSRFPRDASPSPRRGACGARAGTPPGTRSCP